jgi:hypothetical protein
MKEKTIRELFIAMAGLIFLLQGCVEKHNTYGVIGIPAISKDGKYTACIVAKSEGTSQYENPTYRKTDYSISYWLKLYETSSGKLKEKKKLIDKNAVSPDVECFGVYENTLWVYANGITAYDINTLEEKTNEEKIAKANGMKKTIFPYGSRLVNAAVQNGFIDFIADNGEEYRLTFADLKIKNKQSIEEVKNETVNSHHLKNKDTYGMRSDTLNNKLYILAKDETDAKNGSLFSQELNETAARLKLFNAAYALSKLGMHDSYAIETINSLSETTYLNGCFAKNTSNGKVIHLSNPDGYLIIHNDTLGEKSKAIISRIDTHGKTIWETATGISIKIEHCILSGKYCIITTNKDYMFNPHIGKDALCFIDTENGHIAISYLNE